MRWHCGLLDPLEAQEKLRAFRRSNWHALSDEMECELRIWLAMPGFSLSYHVETFDRELGMVKAFMGGYDRYQDEVAENWISATRDDCIKLGYRRPAKGTLPLLTKLQIRRDYLSGRAQKDIAAEFEVWPATVNKLCWGLPDEIEGLPEEIKGIINRDPYLTAQTRKGARRLRALLLGTKVIHRPPLSQEESERIERIALGARKYLPIALSEADLALKQPKLPPQFFDTLRSIELTGKQAKETKGRLIGEQYRDRVSAMFSQEKS